MPRHRRAFIVDSYKLYRSFAIVPYAARKYFEAENNWGYEDLAY